ncbi:hypothetical protein D3C75_1382260 [compost metagenome]
MVLESLVAPVGQSDQLALLLPQGHLFLEVPLDQVRLERPEHLAHLVLQVAQLGQ